MKFALEAREDHDDSATIQVVQTEHDLSRCLALVKCNLDLVDGKLVLHINMYNTAAKPDIEFEVGQTRLNSGT